MTPFYKFQGTGNDFIMLDGFNLTSLPSSTLIREICNRPMGIGADGLIIIKPALDYDFEMVYYNADGSLATMCGNGARCAVAFCHMLGLLTDDIRFLAGDGPHTAEIIKTDEVTWQVTISMRDTEPPKRYLEGYLVNTGTHHLVTLTENLLDIDVKTEGPKLRNAEIFLPDGVNVNWFSMKPGQLAVRTFEKGVEDETYSCGTGVTASAIVAGILTLDTSWHIDTKGGALRVWYNMLEDKFTDIHLQGPAKLVFIGETNMI